MSGDDSHGVLWHIGDGVKTATELAGVATNLGLAGPLPQSVLAPPSEPSSIVEQVETPAWAASDTASLVDQAAAVQEAEINAATTNALELGEALTEPESAWNSSPPDVGEGWLDGSEPPVPEMGETWADTGDVAVDPGGAADMGVQGPGGAW